MTSPDLLRDALEKIANTWDTGWYSDLAREALAATTPADPPNDTSSEAQVNEPDANDVHVTCPACYCTTATYPTRADVPLGSTTECDEHGEFTVYESSIWVRSEAAARVAAQAAARHAASPVAPRPADHITIPRDALRTHLEGATFNPGSHPIAVSAWIGAHRILFAALAAADHKEA